MSADFVESKPLHKHPTKSGRDILDNQYKGGRAVIERADWARDAFEHLRRICPHVPEEELLRLFHNRSQSQLELIQGDALFREYNAAHPLGRKKVKPKAKPAPRAAPPAPAPPPKVAAKPPPPPKAKEAKAKPKAPVPKARPVKAAPRRPAAAKAKARRR